MGEMKRGRVIEFGGLPLDRRDNRITVVAGIRAPQPRQSIEHGAPVRREVVHSLRRRDQTRCAFESSVRRERQPKRIEIVGLARCQASNITHDRLTVLGRQAPQSRAVSAHGSHSRAKLNMFRAALNTIYRRLGRRRTVSWVLLFLGPPGNHTGRNRVRPIGNGRAWTMDLGVILGEAEKKKKRLRSASSVDGERSRPSPEAISGWSGDLFAGRSA